MLELNAHVMQALTERDISAVSLASHMGDQHEDLNSWVTLRCFSQAPSGIVVVTHGDVVACDNTREFGILSGDDLVVRLACELPDVSRLVFAMGGVEGVLESPPSEDEKPVLLEALTKRRNVSRRTHDPNGCHWRNWPQGSTRLHRSRGGY